MADNMESRDKMAEEQFDPKMQELRKLVLTGLQEGTGKFDLHEYFLKYREIATCTLRAGEAEILYVTAVSVDLVMQEWPHSLQGKAVTTRRPVAAKLHNKPEADVKTKGGVTLGRQEKTAVISSATATWSSRRRTRSRRSC